MVTVKEFTTADYNDALRLWQNTEGVCNCKKCAYLDLKENVEKFLDRNKGLSFAAVDNHEVIGVVLCGHDGRKATIYRLTVSESRQNAGIGKRLVEASVNALKQEGLTAIQVGVLNDNEKGRAFWDKMGFKESEAAVILHYEIGDKN